MNLFLPSFFNLVPSNSDATKPTAEKKLTCLSTDGTSARVQIVQPYKQKDANVKRTLQGSV